VKLFNSNHNGNTTKVNKNEPLKKRLVLKPEPSFKKSSLKDEMEFIKKTSIIKVCVYRGCGGIGDIIMATPLLKAIKEEYPNYNLSFAVDTRTAGDLYASLVKNAPFIDNVISAQGIVKENFNLFKDISSVCLQYENSGLPPLNRIDIFANACGFKLKDHLPFYKVEDDEDAWAKEFISKKSNKPLSIMLHTASFDIKRTWPINKYTELIKEINKERKDITFFVNDFQNHNPNWNQYKDVVNISQFSIREIGALTKNMDLFIGPDSGPMHIAGALGTKGIILFGSIPPEARINHYPSLQGMTAGLACSPCWYKGCPFSVKCMSLIKAEHVVRRVYEII